MAQLFRMNVKYKERHSDGPVREENSCFSELFPILHEVWPDSSNWAFKNWRINGEYVTGAEHSKQKWLGFMIGIKQNWNMILNDELQVLF